MKMKKLTAVALVGAMVVGMLGTGSIPAKADGSTTDYVLTIPAKLTVENAGWNDAGGITAKTSGTFDSSQKLTVTAASGNGWKLQSGTNAVGYNLAIAGDNSSAYNSNATAASWEFAASEITTSGTKQGMGIIVENYEDKPAGTYQDTVTFTASVENAGIPVESVAINNAPTEALFVNSTGTLTATVLPNDATDKTVTWSSSDPDYVSINAETGEYTIMGKKGYGSATITATATNGTEDTSDDVTTTCTITGKVTYTSLSVGTVLRTGDTFYTGNTVCFQGSNKASFGTLNGVITIVEAEKTGYNNKYYQCRRGSNGTYPNWSYVVKDNTDGLYITGGSGTSQDSFTLAVHTK